MRCFESSELKYILIVLQIVVDTKLYTLNNSGSGGLDHTSGIIGIVYY